MSAEGERRRADRRRAERRAGERRSEPRQEAEPSGAWRPSSAGRPEGPSTLTAALGGEPDPSDSNLLAREAHRVARAPGGALQRILRTYMAARAAVGLALVGAQAVIGGLGAANAPGAVTVCLLYAIQAAVLWLLPGKGSLSGGAQHGARLRRREWVQTIGADLLAFGLLHILDAGTSFNYAALLVLPVLMSGVLTSRLLALGTASGVALLLLGVTLRSVSGSAGEAVVLAQSGLAGMGLFVIALMSGEMAGRMAREELAARGSLELARQQAQLNRLVIEEMADGVLVIDRRLRVRAANPAARQLLVPAGLAPPAPFGLRELGAVEPLCAAVETALAEERWPDGGLEVPLVFSDSLRRVLRMRVRFTRSALVGDPDASAGIPQASEGLCVVLLEDARMVQARLRQEKLAAMGRVSAGIAHEFRNPLAAIAQANALLLEESLPPSQLQLGQMVSDNVRRLQRIVDDVLELAPGADTSLRVIDVRHTVEVTAHDWARTVGVEVGEEGRIKLDLPPAALEAVFDPEHLRRVLVNLLDNALRHGTQQPQAILLRLAVRDEQSVVLAIANDGPVISAEVEPRLFEPFFSTRSRGSGLGLYICRELCERYGASIEYRARSPSDRHRNGFVVRMRRGLRDAAAEAAPQTTSQT